MIVNGISTANVPVKVTKLGATFYIDHIRKKLKDLCCHTFLENLCLLTIGIRVTNQFQNGCIALSPKVYSPDLYL